MTARRAGAADWPEVVALRTRVFVEEQWVPAEIEQDAHDSGAVHVLDRDDDGRVVATGGRLRHTSPCSARRMVTCAIPASW